MPDDPAPHPNGPRTFANVLRDSVPMPTAVLGRLAAAEQGRHPTLTDLRAALGIEMSTDDWRPAARRAWPDRAAEPDDGACARIVDAMHAAITSPRRIAVQITDGDLKASRERGEIVIRDEEHLVLLVFAANETVDGVRFSAESHGEGMGGYIEPHRAGSGLFDAGAMHPGSYLLPVMITAAGRPTTIDLPIDCRPSGILRVRIVDDETGDPVAARVYLADDAGPAWPVATTIRRDVHGNAFFHADGAFDARCSGTARLRIMRGIEYDAFQQEVRVTADGVTEIIARIRRWSHMAADGWYSGDVHVHLHYGGDLLLTPADAALAQRAEDVNFMNMMVANQGSGWIHDADLFTGAPHELSDETHILRWGEEYRNDFYGHMCMYGIDALVPPVYSGVRESDHPHDLPANAVAAGHCHDVGGTLSYAHPLFRSDNLDAVFDPKEHRSVEAKELPVDAALGLVDAVDLMSYPSHNLAVASLWYRLLNCGHRLAATAGTDTFMNESAAAQFSNPPAGVRAYARVDGAFTIESWCAAVRAGRTFVTNAPMLSLEITPLPGSQPPAAVPPRATTAAGSQPPPAVPSYTLGDDLHAASGDILRIDAAAGSAVPMDRIELIVNGDIIASAGATEGGTRAAISHDLTIAGTCWVAARVHGPKSPLVLDPGESDAAPPGDVYAHTSPVYVSVPGQPQASAVDAAYFVDWVERLIEQVNTHGRYPSDAMRADVVTLFRRAQDWYRAMLRAR